MNINTFLLIIAALANIWLGFFIYRRNPANSINRSFSIFAINMAFWTTSVYMGIFASSEASALFWIRMSFATAILIPCTFYIFSCVFPEGKKVQLRDVRFLIISGIVVIAVFNRNLLKGVKLGRQIPETDYGFLFPLYIAYFLFVFGLAFFKLFRKWKGYTGIKRLQIHYVFLGVFLLVVLASATNFLAPLLGIQQTEGYGPIFALIMTTSIVYAITKYHLMDITIVIKRTTLYALLTASITAGYICIVLLSNWLFGGIMGLQTLIPAMVAALLIAFAFAPVKEAIQAFIDKTLFKKRYDHRKILSDLSRILTSIYSLEELLSLILRVITKAMGVERGSIFLPQYPGNAFIAMAHHGNDGSMSDYGAIAPDSPLIRKLQWRRDLVIREQLDRLPKSQETKDVVTLLEGLKADICVPIFSKDTLTGILFLGSKETGETFTIEDIEMFNTLSHHLAVAIENAQLYTKVEESKIYQEILLNNLTSGVVAIDLSGRITAFNTRAEKMLGVKAVHALGADLSLLAPELRDVLFDTLRNRVSVSAEEVVVKAGTDKDLPLAVSSSIFNSYDGKTLGALIVFSDLTERKVLEMEMRRADRLASLGTLAAGMAHEIKNPLVALKTFTQLLPEKYNDREFRENFSKLANQEVDRINYLVEQLLDFARPSLPSFRKTDICEILENTLFLLRSKIAEQNVEVRETIEKRPLMIMADGDQIKQVLLNIIINALQAMEEKGMLTVKAGVRFATEAGGVSARGEGLARRLHRLWAQDCVVIEIADTGKGIEPKDLPHLFDPFFTTKESGAGLGLAIAHSIIEEHGGIIDVKSTLGEGTAFLITLPMLPQESPVSVR